MVTHDKATPCTNAEFSDPLPGTVKSCWCEVETIETYEKRLNHNRTCGGKNLNSVYSVNPKVDPNEHDSTKSCSLKADIAIVIDESGSVGEDNFWLTKHGVEKMVRDFNSTGSGSDLRIGTIKFASNSLTETELTSDFDKLIVDLEKTPYDAGWTATREGYNEAFTMLQDNSRGAEYSKTVIFITDGETSVGLAPDKAFSDKFKDAGINIITLGIKGYKKIELLTMSIYENNVVEISDFLKMESVTDKIF
jgi:hypothetical protein